MHKKKITVLTFKKQKKNSRYIYSNCSSTSEVHAALTLLFPAHLYSDRSISLELLSVFLSDSLNYLPEKTAIMSRPKLYIFFQVWSATAGFPAPWFFPVTTGKFPTVAIICIYWCHVFICKNTIKIWLSAKIQYLSAFSRKQTHQFTTYLLLTNEPWYASFPRYAKIWYNTSVLKQEKIE